MATQTLFRLYRYQLLPLDRNNTKDLYNDNSPEYIISNKNRLFAETLLTLPNLVTADKQLIIELRQLTETLFIISIAPNRPVTRETIDSRLEKVDNWPHIQAYILNDPNEQFLLVQDRNAAFANTDTVANIIKRKARNLLEKLGLSLHIESLFDKAVFWSLVKEHKNKITHVEFEFVTPNMSNISETLSVALKGLGKETNAVKEELALCSDPHSSLDISPDNETIQGLVDYTSQGGGDITLKIRGIRKKIRTSKSVKQISVTGIELTAPPEQLEKNLKSLLGALK
jgi:hypothetical protein